MDSLAGKTTAVERDGLVPESDVDYLSSQACVESVGVITSDAHAVFVRRESGSDPRAGEQRQISRIELVDREKLARLLDVAPRWSAVSDAEQALAPSLERFTVLRQVFAAWKRGTQVRKTTASAWPDWADAVHVVQHCQDAGGTDLAIRRLSTLLFADSKRVQELWSLMDVLLQGSVAAPVRSDEEVFGELGLVKFPPTLLLAGTCTVNSQGQQITLARPYLGFAPRAIDSFSGIESTRVFLSVENLTTFHELTRLARPGDGHLLLYSAGMPSPSWLRVYSLLLEALPIDAKIFHAGDIDAGGFRIAEFIAKAAQRQKRSLHLHGMDGRLASTERTERTARRALKESEVGAIRRTCERWGWLAEAEWTAHWKLAIEQESMATALPG